MPSISALHNTALFIMSPREITFVGPRPMRFSVAAVRMALQNWRMKASKRYDIMLGAISVKMILNDFSPFSGKSNLNSAATYTSNL